MKTFLEEVAEDIFRKHQKLEALTVVFPNRRAALFFRKHLSAFLTRPAFAPRILTIEDFISTFSSLKVPDKLVLISVLFGAYRKEMDAAGAEQESDRMSSFEHFFFWGEMLLRDFDEVDKYLIPADQLFRDLTHQKELDSDFDFLTEEQRKFLVEFWGHFDVDQSANKRKFLYMWRRLAGVYARFRADLEHAGLAYEGMLHRQVAEGLSVDKRVISGPLVFAGFNALTKAEETIISECVGQYGADVYWDTDAYYVHNVRQEAGRFFREYQENKVLGSTFRQDVPAHFQEKIRSGKEVNLYGAAQPVGQAKLMSQILKVQMEKGLDPEETLVVLADEKLLMPVLHGISGSVDKLNVTMGFPLSGTPFFNFVELLMELQITRRADHFNHRAVVALLGHPYVLAADAAKAGAKRKEILKCNWVHIPQGFLATEVSLHRVMFREVHSEGGSAALPLVRYLQAVTREVGSLASVGDFDKEYAFHFLKFFNLLESVLSDQRDPAADSSGDVGESGPDVRGFKTFLRLFRQLVRTQKIPFSGEPLKGLQVMGVLETRNLDFKNVFVLSLNEGAFPATGGKGSYIPHNIRKAYGLPTMAHQDAMYSYLFYRVLQRAENIFLFYNSETDVLGQGEMSRYLQQLLYESGLNIRKHVLHNPIRPQRITPVRIEKTEEVMKNLCRLNEVNERYRGISPSALNSYLECRLQFYLRYVARIREADEVEEELDARVLGTFLHDVMEKFYKELAERKGTKLVEKTDFAEADKSIDALIDQVFIRTYRLNPDRPVVYAGQRLVVREIVKRFAGKILAMDEAYAPFTIEALEHGDLTYRIKISRPPFEAVLGGMIDRVDSKDDMLRIIDYKTGKDELNFESLDSLFVRDGKRNKAAFQTLLYALMYVRPDAGMRTARRVVPGLMNRINLFDEDFEFGLRVARKQVSDVSPMFPEFRTRLTALLEELFDIDQPFDQTTNTDVCRYCAYRHICYR